MTISRVLEINGQHTIDRILDQCRTIAVVGLSSSRYRASYNVASYMKLQGYKVIAVNPNETEVLGERAYPSLFDIPEQVDLVDVFRRPD
jgi:predicted CoA-binding protein